MEDTEGELAALARALVQVAVSTDEMMISRRLTSMAAEVMALADEHAADSRIYHSATLFLHRVSLHTANGPHADERHPGPTQRH